jgi:catechol 2,3-dioxygenase-like lactoylglutathione lyase family enzyme
VISCKIFLIISDKKLEQHIAHIALVVKDYDEAIRFYTEKLKFTLVEDTVLSETKRWVLVSPKGSKECCLLLARAANEEQKSRIGNQTGGRVFLFLYTDDFWRDYSDMKKEGIEFVREPKAESYGTVAVFKDLYDNLWDLLEPKNDFKTFS